MRARKALVRLRRHAGSSEPLLLADVINTNTKSRADQFVFQLPFKEPIPYIYIILSMLIICRAPGHIEQSVTCLATDACLTADPGVTSSSLALSHTLVEINHEIISTVI